MSNNATVSGLFASFLVELFPLMHKLTDCTVDGCYFFFYFFFFFPTLTLYKSVLI